MKKTWNKDWNKEIPLVLIPLVPLMYYLFGVLRRFEIKTAGTFDVFYIVIFTLLPMVFYAYYTILPLIDPSKNMNRMGGKYYRMKFALVFSLSVLGTFIINYYYSQRMPYFKMIYVLAGLIFVITGNYLPAVKKNYHLGFRFAWTLENERVWTATHRFGGRVLILMGTLMMLCAIWIPIVHMQYLFLLMVLAMGIVVYAYSYFKYRSETGKIKEDQSVK